MSSLRNAVKRITHKERAQPQSRAHLGFLEKKQDYKRRAEHYHRKQDWIQSAKLKASMRNPDEFYFGMSKAAMKNGEHQKTDAARHKDLEGEIGPEAVRVMKDQDLSYVRMQQQKDLKKVQKLKHALHFIGGEASNPSRHTIFAQSKEEATNFDPVQHFGTAPESADRAFNRPRTSVLRAAALELLENDVDRGTQREPTTEDLKSQSKRAKQSAIKAAKARSNAYGELEARVKRAAVMGRAEARLVTEKLVAGKGRKRKIKSAEAKHAAQYKWRKKRKR